ncbi:diguanylate cyclase domain-containing protein [Synechococcus sp. CS-1328]|uniref:diguanylate cyclase domain-containing protein n=1 Tax=Synechococcus sp. CS-1328 TaxID=2847976 RepID=UPI00223AB74B|nr:diguanylate cyclase [Synechococcus sp. CS-1328]MCT0224777.1 diguanylate cyclase [Synechococcus sp. CS-1328]
MGQGSSEPPSGAAGHRRKRWILALALATLFTVDLILPRNFPLLPYYFVVVVLSASFATPRQMAPLIAEAYVLAIASGLYWGFFPSLEFGTRLLGLSGVVLVAVRLSAQRCQMVTKLHRSEETLRLTLDNASLGIALASADGRLTRVNPALCQIFGRDADTLLSLTWRELSHPDDSKLELPLFEELVANRRSSYRLRKQFLRGDGTAAWIDLSVSCVRQSDGGVDFFIGEVVDINLQVAAEQAKAHSEKQMRLSIGAARVGVAICTPGTGQFLMLSPPLCKLLGQDAATLQSKGFLEALRILEPTVSEGSETTEAQAIDPIEEVAAVLAEEQNLCQMRLRLKRLDGSVIWGDLQVSNLRDSEGTAQEVMVELIDISELVAKTDYLQAAASAGVVGIWDWDVPRNILHYDPVMFRLYGRDPSQFSGAYEAWAEALHPQDKAATEAAIQSALRGESVYAPRFRVVWPDGSVHHIQAASHTSFDRQGRPLRMVGVNYEVTELVQAQESLNAERLRLRTTLDSLLDPHLMLGPVLNADGQITDLRILQANPAAAAYNQMPVDRFTGATIREFWPAHVTSGLFDRFLEVLASGQPLLLDDFVMYHDIKAQSRHFDIRAVKVDGDLSITWRDVSEKAQAMARLAASEQQFRLLAKNATDVVVHLAVDDTVLWVSPSLQPVLGWQPAAWIGHPIGELVEGFVDRPCRPQANQGKDGPCLIRRDRVCSRDGSPHWIESHWSPFLNDAGEADGQVCTFRIIDLEVSAERELERRAATDSLTALLNREEMFGQIKRLTAQQLRKGQELAVLFCDLDHFKAVNDTYGHNAGDAVLQAMAARVRSCLRSSDLAARIGGDELLVVLPGVQGIDDAISIAEKLRQLASQPVPISDGEVIITISVGVALAQSGESLDALIARADSAMYDAKQNGRDQVVAITAEA